jgi:YD repeat-containing protein
VNQTGVKRSKPKFAAFISYRHVPQDREWAQRLVDRLERFRTPKPLVRLGYPPRLGRIFRDDDEAGVDTPLTEQILEALEGSDFLIVICSPRTAASQWIAREIKVFCSLGRQKRIIPVVIEGEPHHLDLAKLLLCEDADRDLPLAADVRGRQSEPQKISENRAVLRIAAGILGCRYDDLAQRDAERTRKKRIRFVASALTLIALAAISAVVWWDQNMRVKTSYFAAMKESWGAPVGVYALSAQQATRRFNTYRMLTQGGQAIEVARVNGAGALRADPQLNHADEAWVANVARWKYTYYRDGSVAAVEQFDQFDSPLRTFSYQFSPNRQEGVLRFELAFGVAERDSANIGSMETLFRSSEKKHSEIGQHRLHFDYEGRLVRRSFEAIGGGMAACDSLGVCGKRYKYDEVGQQIEMVNTTADGQLLPTAGLPVIVRVTRNKGEVIQVQWVDGDGNLSPNKAGVAQVNLQRDNNGNIVQESFSDAAGKPVIDTEWGYAIKSYRYDAHGNMIEGRYRGPDGQNILKSPSAVHMHRQTFDGNGRSTEQRTFGLDGELATDSRSGCTIWRYVRDVNGRQARSACYDQFDRPTLQIDYGIHATTWVYDAQGRPVETATYDAEGNPSAPKSGIARGLREYDARGNLTRWRGFGPQGEPLGSATDGVPEWRYVFDQRGNEVEAAAFDASGRRAHHLAEGWSIHRQGYDERGNRRESKLFAVDEKPVINSSTGAASTTYRYNSAGAQIEALAIGVDGKPTWFKDGYASIRYVRDAAGRVLERSYFDLLGEPVNDRKEGVHKIKLTYDVRGDWVKREVLDEKGTPTLAKDDNTAIVTRRFDPVGRLIETRYFGILGEPAKETEEGVHAIRQNYDQFGNRIERSVFSTELRPVAATDDSAAIIRYTFDAAGRETSHAYFGADGRPIAATSVHAHMQRTIRDARGNEIEWRYYGVDGRPVAASDDGVHCWQMTYDARDRMIERTFLDVHGRVIRASDDGVALHRWTYDVAGRKTGVAYFGEGGEPILHATEGIHRWKWDHDALGRTVRTRSFGIDGELRGDLETGVAESTRTCDSRGNLLEKIRFDEAGRVTGHKKDGIARIVNKYDLRDNIIETETFSAEGNLIIPHGSTCGRTRYQYDARDIKITEWCSE